LILFTDFVIPQLKEEFENDPDFLGDYAVSGKKGGPAA
jgi:hypothetical protein